MATRFDYVVDEKGLATEIAQTSSFGEFLEHIKNSSEKGQITWQRAKAGCENFTGELTQPTIKFTLAEKGSHTWGLRFGPNLSVSQANHAAFTVETSEGFYDFIRSLVLKNEQAALLSAQTILKDIQNGK
jgi:hypothetical protein